MAEKQIMVKIDHVSKEYRLGAIGGTTLREDLERFHDKNKKKRRSDTENRPENTRVWKTFYGAEGYFI